MYLDQFKNISKKKIAVIGSGVIGTTSAWHLAELGYEVVIISPDLNKKVNYSENLSGTNASLGVLMGYVFKRSSGRSWRLRKRSMQLWPEWLNRLSTDEIPLKIHTPLVVIASSPKEQQLMVNLSSERQSLGLEFFSGNTYHHLSRCWPNHQFGGLISHYDGRLDPKTLMKSLISKLKKLNVNLIKAKVSHIKKESLNHKEWLVHLSNKDTVKADAVVICTACGSESLISPLGYSRPIEPVLGQALHLECLEKQKNWDMWPAVLTYEGVNLIPKKSTNTFLMGATLEPGINANKIALQKMQSMKDNCPEWIKASYIKSHWKGIRAKPIGRPAPLLESLEDGLILNTAHYRNGILLAPACAEWVGNELLKTILSQ